MTSKAGSHALSLFHKAYEPFERLADLAACAVRVAAEGTCSEFASIALLPVASLCSEPLAVSYGVQPTEPVQTSTVPLHFDRQQIGTVRFANGSSDAVQVVADLIEQHICRLLIECYAATRSDRDIHIVGTSDKLTPVDEFIKKSASSALPVLIHGALGSREERIAYALHYAGTRRDAELVEIQCATAQLSDIQRNLKPGEPTVDLFLRDIDHLDVRFQNDLAGCIETLLGSGATNVRVLASTTADLRALTATGRFSSSLMRSFDYLQIGLAPLCERTKDIRPLMLKFLRKHSPIPRDISAEALAALENYSWPENVSEAERVMARVAVMADGPSISADDLYRHARRILGSHHHMQRPHSSAESTLEIEPSAMIRALVRGEQPRQLDLLHPALRRAITFLESRSAPRVTLPELARVAHVSPSHLASLFRSLLGMTFKSALSQFRTEQAKELMLRNRDTPLGDIAEELGFQDPRHFQRVFKRWAGCTPSQFRRFKTSDLARTTVPMDSGGIAHAASRRR